MSEQQQQQNIVVMEGMIHGLKNKIGNQVAAIAELEVRLKMATDENEKLRKEQGKPELKAAD